MVATMPEKMSMEKEKVLRILGSDVIRTPTEADFFAPNSHINLAFKMEKENQKTHHVVG